MKRFLPLQLALLVLLQSIVLSAQVPTPTPSTSKGKEEIVVINTNLIRIDVTVTDKDGKAVTDLKKEDFEIYENDKLQPVTTFSFVATESENAALQSQTKKDSTKSKTSNVPNPSEIRPEQVQRTIALVVDDLGLSFASTEWTKRALKKYIDEQIQPGELVAIIRTSSGVGALQQFTSDKRLLHAAIDRLKWNVRGGAGLGSFTPIEPTLTEVEEGRKRMDQTYTYVETSPTRMSGSVIDRENKTDAREAQEGIFAAGTLGAVNFVMRGMGPLPGRKAIVLFSDGFKLFSRKGITTRVKESLEKLTDAANRAGVIIYTMDARGVDSPMLSAQDDTYGLNFSKVYEQVDQRRSDFFDSQQGLRYVAEQTGGFAITNQNDLSKGLERILEDQKRYYLIGYEPDDEIFEVEKRRFNKLTVKVNRPGVRIRYRSGFFGMTDADAKPEPKNAIQQLVAALTSPFTTKDIDLRLTSLFASDKSSGTFMRSLIFIKGSDLKFKEEKDGWYKSEFDISALTFGDNGEVIDQINRKQTIRAHSKDLKNLYDNGLVSMITLPIQKPGAYQMRVALRDSETGRIGSASQYIEVPNIKKKNLTLSGIVLERVETKETNQPGSSINTEFRTQRDAAMRRFQTGETVRFGLSVYNAKVDKASNKPNLLMQYKIYRDGKEIFSSPEKNIKFDSQQTNQVIDASDAFSLGRNMQLGDYSIQVIIKDMLAKENRQIATHWTDFEIIP